MQQKMHLSYFRQFLCEMRAGKKILLPPESDLYRFLGGTFRDP